MVKRFVLFTYDAYYPGGGWNDKVGDFASVEEARLFMRDVVNEPERNMRVSLGEYYDVVDLWAGEIVDTGSVPTKPRDPDKGPWLAYGGPAYDKKSDSFCILGAIVPRSKT